MKTKLYLPIISLLAMSVFAFISCDDSDSDTTKPVIELSEPEEGQELKIGDEHGVHFEMDLSDDVMLKSYMIEIHSNFDHHSHGKSRAAATGEATVDFSFNRSYDISGKKTAHIHHHDIVIPANATGRLSSDGLLHGCRRKRNLHCAQYCTEHYRRKGRSSSR